MDPMTSPAAQGDYRGDFTRDTFAPPYHFSRVLMQQGRVQLDADWNEQVSILLHLARRLAADLLGQHAGIAGAFAIDPVKTGGQLTDLDIAPGHYYVDGVLAENEVPPNGKPYTYFGQPYLTPQKQLDAEKLPEPPFVVYLDVWERHVTDFDEPAVREVALGGPDTATRAQVLWQVRFHKPPAGQVVKADDLKDDKKWAELALPWRGPRAALRAWVAALPDPTEVEPCAVPPDAGYRGPENQLYRVEIHTGGNVKTATFKWSRNNASEFYPVRGISGQELRLWHLGRDDRSALRCNDWVELIDPLDAQWGRAGELLQVSEVNREDVTVQLARVPAKPYRDRMILRRWDHRSAAVGADGAIPLNEGKDVEIEEGIRGRFAADGIYVPGMYWLVPARAAIRDILWDRDPAMADPAEAALPRPPHGPAHHYAPLAFVAADGTATDVRREINKIVTQK
jgi:hypothetical protein